MGSLMVMVVSRRTVVGAISHHGYDRPERARVEHALHQVRHRCNVVYMDTLQCVIRCS